MIESYEHMWNRKTKKKGNNEEYCENRVIFDWMTFGAKREEAER